jgi:signal transduction histidine kinase
VQLIEETLEEQNIRISDTIKTRTEIKILCEVNNKEMDDIANTNNARTGGTSVNVEAAEYEVARDNNNNEANTISGSFLLEADRTKISQVVSNMLSNAVTSIRLMDDTEEGRISISISKREKIEAKNVIGRAEKVHDRSSSRDEIIVSIKDNGQGIPPEVDANLFTKFVTGSDSGTGLGLYISKNIIEAHGGRIWASNNNTEETEGTTKKCSGATFNFTLPLNHI